MNNTEYTRLDRYNYDIEPFHKATVSTGQFKSKGIERTRHLIAALGQVAITGHVLEFGVYRGKTMQAISKHFSAQPVWGFDSFVGLPEPWYTSSTAPGPSHKAGTFDMRLEAVQPVFADNVNLVPGWYDQSLPLWLERNPGPVSFLHVDCDLYSSTKTVLNLLNSQLTVGTVIVFDEFYPWADYQEYDLWQQGEYRALGEWLRDYDRKIEIVMRSRHQQCCVRVIQ